MGIKWRQFYEDEVSQLIESMAIKSPLYNNGILYDFYIAILRDNPNPWEWHIFRDLIFNCDCIFAFEGVCFVCVRVACRRRIAPAFFPLTVKTAYTQKVLLQFNLQMGSASTPITI